MIQQFFVTCIVYFYIFSTVLNLMQIRVNFIIFLKYKSRFYKIGFIICLKAKFWNFNNTRIILNNEIEKNYYFQEYFYFYCCFFFFV